MAAETGLDDEGFDEWARAAVFSGLITFREPVAPARVAREGETKPPCVMFVESPEPEKGESRDCHGDFHTWASEAVFSRLSSLSMTSSTSNVVNDEHRDDYDDSGSRNECFNTWASERVFSCLPVVDPTPSPCKEQLSDSRRMSNSQCKTSHLDEPGKVRKDVASHQSSSASSIIVVSHEKKHEDKPGSPEDGWEPRSPTTVSLCRNSISNPSFNGVNELPSFEQWATGVVFKNMGIDEGRSEGSGNVRAETDQAITQQRRQTKQEIKVVLAKSRSEPPIQVIAGDESIVEPNRTLVEDSSPPQLCPDRISFEGWAGGVVFNNLSETVLGTDKDTNSDMLCTVGGAVTNPDQVENVSFNVWADEVVFKNIPGNNLVIDKNMASNGISSDRRGQYTNGSSSQPMPGAALDESIAAQTDVRTNGNRSGATNSIKLLSPPKEGNLERLHPSSEKQKLFIPETASTRSTFEEWATSVIFGGMSVKEKSSEVCEKSLPVKGESISIPEERAHLKSDTGPETEHFENWASSVVFNGIDARKKQKNEPSRVDETHPISQNLHQNGIKSSVEDVDKSLLDCAANCIKRRDEQDTSRGGSDRSEEASKLVNLLMESPPSRVASNRHERKPVVSNSQSDRSDGTFTNHDSSISEKLSSCSNSIDAKSELFMESEELNKNESLNALPGLRDEVAKHKSVEEMKFEFGQADGSGLHGVGLSSTSENIPNTTHVDEGKQTVSNFVDGDGLKHTQNSEDSEAHPAHQNEANISDRKEPRNEGTVDDQNVPQGNQKREVHKKKARSKSPNIRFDYLIPQVVLATAIKARLEDRVGLVFVDKGHKIVLGKMTSRSLFLHSKLSVGDELLTVNNHRVKNAEKAAEFIKLTVGPLRLVTFTGKRPRESSLVMLRRNSFNPSDVWLTNRNGMVYIVKARGKFCRSIRDGDVLLSVDGHAVLTTTRASELLTKPEGSDPEAGQVAIILVFSLAKLRHKLVMKLGRKLPFKWNDNYSECSQVHSESRLLKIHNDGNVESLSRLGIGPAMLDEIEAFASLFYDSFQQAMDSLHRALTDAAREGATILHSHSC